MFLNQWNARALHGNPQSSRIFRPPQYCHFSTSGLLSTKSSELRSRKFHDKSYRSGEGEGVEEGVTLQHGATQHCRSANQASRRDVGHGWADGRTHAADLVYCKSTAQPESDCAARNTCAQGVLTVEVPRRHPSVWGQHIRGVSAN
jgi:hypothetical protein